jgi:hypothetical protein
MGPFGFYCKMFLKFLFRKTISIPIIEEESYEKNVVMYVKLGEPKHIAGNAHIWTHIFMTNKTHICTHACIIHIHGNMCVNMYMYIFIYM